MSKALLRAKVLGGGKDLGDKVILSWDTSQIAEDQVAYLMEERPEDYPEEDTAYAEVYDDCDLYEFEWEWVMDSLEEILKGINPDGYPWHVEVSNFGWRGLDGYRDFQTLDPREFLRKILPDTQCTWYMYKYGEDGLAINNFHHDSCTGREWYHITKQR